MNSDKDMKAEMKMKDQIGAYHTTEAVKVYNDLAEMYNKNEFTPDAREKAIYLFKRAIPHIKACQELNYKDERIIDILAGMKEMMMSETFDEMPLVKI